MAGDEAVMTSLDGRQLRLTNLDKVLYPAVGFTKAQVIDYYARIAAVMVPHLSGRCITMRRWPDGVDGESFFNKRCPSHRPDWVETAPGPGDGANLIDYCRVDEAAALVWMANLAALELHAPTALACDLDTPTLLVFDLDPGEPAGLVECCQVAEALRKVLDSVGLMGVAKTSGSKGLQVYVPLNATHTHDHARGFALAVGQLLMKQFPDQVVVEMKKSLRAGKILIDWSQNVRYKTTIAPYSLRGRETPTVSTPVTWVEVAECATGKPMSFRPDQVLDRVSVHGDLFRPVLEHRQSLPQPR